MSRKKWNRLKPAKLMKPVSRVPPSYHRVCGHSYLLYSSNPHVETLFARIRMHALRIPVSAASATLAVLKRVKRGWFRRIARRVRRAVRRVARVVRKVVKVVKKVICLTQCSRVQLPWLGIKIICRRVCQ